MTMRIFRLLIALGLAASVTSCSLFDSGVEWRAGLYALLWIDTADNISLCRDLGKGSWIGRVDAMVYAVGWNGRYVVAKQHPAGDRRKTDYFIIDSLRDSDLANLSAVVLGPLSKDEYGKKAVELKLPDFTKVLESLE
jgi:hypothetical protein